MEVKIYFTKLWIIFAVGDITYKVLVLHVVWFMTDSHSSA
jgi:hypothetical protein